MVWTEKSTISIAVAAIAAGAKLIAANFNQMYPTEQTILPGSTAMVGAITAATDHEPDVIIRKPNVYLLTKIATVANIRPDEMVVIGDSLEHDTLLANKFGAASILVLTGVTFEKELKQSDGNKKPTLIIKKIDELLEKINWLGS